MTREVCADPECAKPIYKGADGKYGEDRRGERKADAAPFTGEERRKAPKPAPKDEKPPRRDHVLNRPIFGRRDAGA